VPGGERADAGVPAAAALPPGHAVLLDRELERGQIDRVLDLARQGRSAALVLQGEPGIGKTTLLDYAVESGRDFETVRVLGIESEAELGFAALHQLVLPFAAGLGSLPVPQRDALAGALGLRRANSPDRFLLALAALTMLADAATRRPLLCVVDDAQWLDRESASILGFIARRLSADAIAMLFAVRDLPGRTTGLEGIPWVQIGGLPSEEAGQLLALAAAGRVDRGVSERIIAQTGGNPLGLIELGGELSREQLAGEASLPELLPAGGSLQARYLRQIRSMPAETQVLLLAARRTRPVIRLCCGALASSSASGSARRLRPRPRGCCGSARWSDSATRLSARRYITEPHWPNGCGSTRRWPGPPIRRQPPTCEPGTGPRPR
jgi:hypothetical protein